jgi:Rieske Fe-S protein/predicted phosphodiesterase
MKDNYSPEDVDGNEEAASPNTKYSRRKLLKCMAGWAGTGVIWTVGVNGLLTACGELTAPASTAPATSVPITGIKANPTPNEAPSSPLAAATTTATRITPGFTFVQVSDTHIGFSAAGVNTDVNATLQQTVSRINALSQHPDFVLHTGDVSHMSKPSEFDTAFQLMNTIQTANIFYVPGEHDVINDQGANFRQRFLAKAPANSWYSMDYQGVHFIGLSNAGELDAFGMLGGDQLAWLQKDLSGVKKDTPLVVFAHVPLFTVYKPWSWETKDSAQALALLKPYSAVTVLNGHIHQVVTQVEGKINFYTANSTAFPQHRPGVEKPNAYQLPASELLQDLGYRTINLIPGNSLAAISDFTLAGGPASSLALKPETAAAAPVTVSTTIGPGGFVDVGAEADFANAATAPQKITLPAPAGKTGIQTAFVLKQGNQYLGLSDVCTHMGCEVSWVGQDSRFECPCHGSQYDITGKNIAGPAPRPLPRFKTQLSNGRLLVSYVPEEAGN